MPSRSSTATTIGGSSRRHCDVVDQSTSVHLLNGLTTTTTTTCLGPRSVKPAIGRASRMKSARDEVRSLQLWRAIIAECLAAFLYVFIVCGAYVTWPPPSPSPHLMSLVKSSSVVGVPSSIVGRTHASSTSAMAGSLLDNGASSSSLSQHGLGGGGGGSSSWNVQAALTSGLAITTVVLCFGRISGGHVNPALTFSLMVTRRVSTLRGLLYITAQCGGSIAGAALLHGVSVPGRQGSLGAVRIHDLLTPWQGFGIEVILAFAVVFAAFAASDIPASTGTCIGNGQWSSPSPSPLIGAAYLVCTLAGLPSTGAAISPARALGPAFVMNRWENHWVYWLGPMSGGLLAGLMYEYIFDPRRTGAEVDTSRSGGGRGLTMALEDINRANSSVHSQDDDYDDPNDMALASMKVASAANGPNRLCYNGHATTASSWAALPNANAYRQQQQPPPPRTQHYDAYNRHNIPLQHYEVLPGRGEPTYGTLACNNPHKGMGTAASTTSSNYGLGRPPTESVYGSSAVNHRPPSSASGNYATIHGNRPGGGSGGMGSCGSTRGGAPLHRLDYVGPDSTKF